jgi:hypothetical protein
LQLDLSYFIDTFAPDFKGKYLVWNTLSSNSDRFYDLAGSFSIMLTGIEVTYFFSLIFDKEILKENRPEVYPLKFLMLRKCKAIYWLEIIIFRNSYVLIIRI